MLMASPHHHGTFHACRDSNETRQTRPLFL
ncbi:hypothetical protein D046_5492A, partial [Vibrio parahaemolyticus V-223/04]